MSLFFPMQPALAQYVHTVGGTHFDEGIEVDLDDAGNAYFIGQFSDTLDFDPGTAESNLQNLNGEEMVRVGELYIAGYSSTGQARFAVSPVGGENTSNGKGFAVALDQEKNVYVTGSFSTALDFNTADTSNGVVPNAGATDVFVASYTSTGQYRYAYGFGGESFDHGSDIVVDAAGNVYVAGMFTGDAFFDPQDADQDGDRALRSSQNTTSCLRVVLTARWISTTRREKICIRLPGRTTSLWRGTRLPARYGWGWRRPVDCLKHL